MSSKHFAQPVAIFVGLGFPRQIETVWEAHEVLVEWNGSRGPTHTMALNACRCAVDGEKDAGSARLAFEAFALSRGILAETAMMAAIAKAKEEWLGA